MHGSIADVVRLSHAFVIHDFIEMQCIAMDDGGVSERGIC